MRTILLALLVALPLTAADAKTSKIEAPEAAAIRHVGDICKPTGGFGRVFGRGYGHVDAMASDDWAPFERLSIEEGAITAEASFRGTGDSLEDDVVQAEKFIKALDKAITAKGKFKHRETSGNARRYSTGREEGSGIVLELHQDREIIVAICSDE